MLVENSLRPVVSVRVPLVISYIEQSGKWPRQWVPQAPEPQSHGASLGYPLIFLAAAEHPGRV